MLIGLALLVLPWVFQQRLPGGLEELALVASGLAMGVFGVAVSHTAGEQQKQTATKDGGRAH